MVQANKLKIEDEAQLLKKEEELSKKKCVELFEKGSLDSFRAGSFDSLQKIHKNLFGEIYDYAGKLRTEDAGKFVPAKNLKAEIDKINKMPNETIEEIAVKFYAMNAAHPFKTGNGRAIRLWLDVMLRQKLSLVIDWSKITKENFFSAIDLSLKNQSDIVSLIKSAISNELDNREQYIHSIDASFAFDGYNTYRTRLLG